MFKANGKWVQIKVEEKKVGFDAGESTLKEGIIVSVGHEVENFKLKQTVLFPATHGKTMEHSIKGTKYYFVDKDIILAYE